MKRRTFMQLFGLSALSALPVVGNAVVKKRPIGAVSINSEKIGYITDISFEPNINSIEYTEFVETTISNIASALKIDRSQLMKDFERSEYQSARVDALMLEYCPDEMTHEQIINWGKHQKRATVQK